VDGDFADGRRPVAANRPLTAPRILVSFVAAANHSGDEGREAGAESSGTDAEILNERGRVAAPFFHTRVTSSDSDRYPPAT
jgi:hypothetical protein